MDLGRKVFAKKSRWIILKKKSWRQMCSSHHDRCPSSHAPSVTAVQGKHPMTAVTPKEQVKTAFIIMKYDAQERAAPNFAPNMAINRGELARYVHDGP